MKTNNWHDEAMLTSMEQSLRNKEERMGNCEKCECHCSEGGSCECKNCDCQKE
jgi:hypothetical protein